MGLFGNSSKYCLVTLNNTGGMFTEKVYTDNPFNAEEIAIARNPGASVIRTQMCLPD